MSILFSGSNTDRKRLNDFTIQVPNHADKIRQQGLQILKGLEKQSQLQQNRSQEILQALKEKAQIESEYRGKAFEFELADNKRVAEAFDHNAGVKVKNLRTKAENEARKYKALADIVGATGEFITATAEMTERRQRKKDEKTLEDLEIQTPAAAAEYQKAYNQYQIHHGFVDADQKEKEAARKYLENRDNKHWVEAVVGLSAKEHQGNLRAIARGFDIESAIQKELQNPSKFRTQNGATLGEIYGAFKNGDGVRNIDEWKQAKKDFLAYTKETYGKHIDKKQWDRFVKSRYDNYWNDKHRENSKTHSRKAGERQTWTNDNYIASTILDVEGMKEHGGPNNMFRDPKKVMSHVLHKLLIEGRAGKSYTHDEWIDLQQERFIHAAQTGKLRSDQITNMRTSKVIKDPANKVFGNGTWEERSPRMRQFFDKLDSVAREFNIEEGKRLREDQQLRETQGKERLNNYKIMESKLPPEELTRGAILNRLQAVIKGDPGSPLAKYLAGQVSVKANMSAVNLAIAKDKTKALKVQGFLTSSQIVDITKHLDDATRFEYLKWHKEMGGDGFSALSKLYARHRTAIEGRIKSTGKWYNIFGGRGDPHESVAAKIGEATADYNERVLELLPDAALWLSKNKPNLTGESLRKATLLKAADLAWEAFDTEWDNSQKGKEGKFTTFLDEGKQAYKYTHYGETLPQGERYYTSDVLNDIKTTLATNPDAFKDPKVINFVSENEIRDMVHSLNRGEAFRPTEAMRSISNEFLNGNNTALFLQELEKFQAQNPDLKLELNETALNNSAFRYTKEVEPVLSNPVKAAVGQNHPPSREGTEILKIEIENPGQWLHTNATVPDHIQDPDIRLEYQRVLDQARVRSEALLNPTEVEATP